MYFSFLQPESIERPNPEPTTGKPNSKSTYPKLQIPKSKITDQQYAVHASIKDDLARAGTQYDLLQARLPLPLGGCGLGDSTRLSQSAYWVSWADCLRGKLQTFPVVGTRTLHQLSLAPALPPAAINPALAPSVTEVEQAGRFCEASGWQERPSWPDLAAGLRPPQEPSNTEALGEWQHGGQYHSTWHVSEVFASLLGDLAWPRTRRNAAVHPKSCLFPVADPSRQFG